MGTNKSILLVLMFEILRQDSQGSVQDDLSGGYTLLKVLLIALNVAFQHFLHSVSDSKISLSDGKNG